MTRLPWRLAGPATLIAVCAITLLALSGCASVITRLEGGRFAVLSAQALGIRPADVIISDKRRLPDGEWRWRARTRGSAIPGSGNHVCTLSPGQPAQCD
jgi:hypothetical protein